MGQGQPFNYENILYNEVIDYLETKWQRKLTDHEKHVVIEGYRFGRMIESENEIRILEAF
ncbi:hypothetical protein COJ96_05805 [Bacillus sp. AFS073361]|uniref:hypothetical protein n=1 Tax=Bacillus sp. AFS073361 TaxID=2033511 RepID=UPI000BF6BE4F|nr:hypothetical protein [Bacillus sp. AFS073361]PFP30226.1 hypothetical protein COJ96_05805 [Bacillus sp. AFS073361]